MNVLINFDLNRNNLSAILQKIIITEEKNS